MRFIRKIIKFICILLFIFGSIFLGSIIYIKLSPKIIINSANNLTLYDKDNNVFFNGSNSKEWVSIDNISKDLINCTIYTEDKNFYSHFGFDFLRIGKALINNIVYRDNIQGASTITQQYAKNMFLDFDKTWSRKFKEMWYTMQIESSYSKNEILEGYLNTINYGHGKYGIENASKYYFNKSAKDLTLAEASLLAGIPKSPSYYSPITNFENSKKRQRIILKSLVNNGIISAGKMESIYNENIILSVNDSDSYEYTSVNYYIDAVINELKSIDKLPSDYAKMNGLKIYTKFDNELQNNLEENIKDTLSENKELQTASVVMVPNTGEIIALVGGSDYNTSTYNRAIFTARQVGSTMKPYLYYSALENGFTTSTSFMSAETSFHIDNNKIYSPKNYNDKYANKPISMAAAVAYSDNIYAVKTNMFLGSENLINVARRVGINSKLENNPSLALGTNEINIIEMTSGYAAFANGGYKINPHFINKIVDGNGNVIYKSKNEKELVLNSSLVFILNNMLTSTYNPAYIDYNYPTAISLSNKLKHTYSLKSGTTDYDNWNIGYNKNVVCAVWIGYDDNKLLTSKDYKHSQNVWYKTVEFYEKNMKNQDVWYKKPNNISSILVDPISGKAANDNTKNPVMMYFLRGTEPKDTDDVFDELFTDTIN